MNIFKLISANIEAGIFCFKFAKNLTQKNPLMSSREVELRSIVAWCNHLEATNRSHYIKKPEVIDNLRKHLVG